MLSNILQEPAQTMRQNRNIGRVFCVIPVHRSNWSECMNHAENLSILLKKSGLNSICDYPRFEMAQTHPIDNFYMGKSCVVLEDLDTEEENPKCLIRFSRGGEPCWRYVIRKEGHTAEEVRELLSQVFGEKQKIFLK